MRPILAPVKNVKRLNQAFGTVECRTLNLPGMALIHGYTGAGKTHTVTNQIIQFNGVYIRGWSTWSNPGHLIRPLAHELEVANTNSLQGLINGIVESLVTNPRPIFVDEVNHFHMVEKMMHVLRDIHDTTDVPVVLISEEQTRNILKRYPQIHNRIYEDIEFLPLDLEDVDILARSICEVEVAEDLLVKILKDSGGVMRKATIALDKIERQAVVKGLGKIDLNGLGRSVRLCA